MHMPSGKTDLTLSAERRAIEHAGRPSHVAPERTAGPALSRRERRVRAILLEELNRMTDGTGLSWAERQHLEKRLDAEYIDRELAKMRKQLGWYPYLLWTLTVVFFAFVLVQIGFDGRHGTIAWRDLMFALPMLPAFLAIPAQRRATRRKMFIYEALRELTDAGAPDDLLDRERAAEARFPHRRATPGRYN